MSAHVRHIIHSLLHVGANFTLWFGLAAIDTDAAQFLHVHILHIP